MITRAAGHAQDVERLFGRVGAASPQPAAGESPHPTPDLSGLRPAPRAAYVPVRSRFRLRYELVVDGRALGSVSAHEHALFESMQTCHPVELKDPDGSGCYWWYAGRFYRDDAGLTDDEVRAAVFKQHLLRRAEVERADRIPRIAPDVLLAVWDRDGGRCVHCGSDTSLRFTRRLALADGGSSDAANLRLECATCTA